MSFIGWLLTVGVGLTLIVMAYAAGWLRGAGRAADALCDANINRRNLQATADLAEAQNKRLRADLNSALEEKWQRS